MKMSAQGVKDLVEEEGFRELAYDDRQPFVKLTPQTKILGVLTIGVGHTGPDVYVGQRITRAEGEALLAADLSRFEKAIARLVKVPLTQGQFDALTSFAFNVGDAALARSTLLRKLNSGYYAGAADEFMRWNKDGGKVVAGLTARRARERAKFMGV